MRKAIFVAIAAVFIGTLLSSNPATAGSLGRFEVSGVEGDDMLKMRAGPGTGYRVILGLPNGTVLRVHTCEQTGGTRWCRVSLEQARGLQGYVSWAYLRKL
ncbi:MULTISPECIES: SH3 domain-containing protein [Ruegeria]|uniref:SH3 domain-containing protein n=3 Tax=Ruegeria TaxID=97050 RepID=A0A9Q3ZPK5_9RHOB|nr:MULTISPECIES: SH3 domain-containing protein [Ruegeria]MCE8540255.1 SH3 domain-containing protein [Ruegeria pomeroyi]MCG6560841.1 SH3 domain-containing protein [Ruegeria alba]NDW44641.1 SH3 domain-containing protein [Ruegeria sp. PrR005]